MHNEEFRQAILDTAGAPLGAAYAYRRKVESIIRDKERSLRLGALAAWVGYVSALLVAVALMVGAGIWYEGQLHAVWLGVNACFWLVFASIVAFHRALAKGQLETLKEVKAIQMRLIEIQERISKGGAILR